jgi:hypothetical protein
LLAGVSTPALSSPKSAVANLEAFYKRGGDAAGTTGGEGAAATAVTPSGITPLRRGLFSSSFWMALLALATIWTGVYQAHMSPELAGGLTATIGVLYQLLRKQKVVEHANAQAEALLAQAQDDFLAEYELTAAGKAAARTTTIIDVRPEARGGSALRAEPPLQSSGPDASGQARAAAANEVNLAVGELTTR